MSAHAPLRIGLISDTHGVLRPAALWWLRDCDHIIHAGDIAARGGGRGSEILDTLRSLAPLTVVRGNNDVGAWADRLKAGETLNLHEVWVQVLHDLKELDVEPGARGIRVVVSGHSHQPLIKAHM